MSQRRRRWATVLVLFVLAGLTVAGSVAQMPFRVIYIVCAVAYALRMGGIILPPKLKQPASREHGPRKSTED